MALETWAFIYLLEQIENGKYAIVCSEALTYENNRNIDGVRTARITSYFELAKEFIRLEETDFERANGLKALGFTDMDALHIASAEKGDIDFLITCDDRMVSLYKKEAHTIKVKIMNLLEFVNMEVK